MGGIPQAIADVRRALGGSVVSLTSVALLPEPSEGVMHVPQSAALAGRLYGWSRHGDRAQSWFDRCDVVLIHGLFRYHYQWAVRLARECSRPYFIFPHGALDPYVFTYRALQKRLWWRLVGRPGLRGAAGIVFTTEREHRKAIPHIGAASSHIIPLPVGMPSLDDWGGLRQRARQQLGIDPSDRALLFLGRFDPMKRLPNLIAAFNRANVAGLHLIVAGPDSHEQTAAQCTRLVAEPLRGRVHFPGAVYGDDKRAMFAAADGFVNISARENFGYFVCEAQAAGLPGIVGPGNDLGPDLSAAGGVWLLPDDDVATLAAAYVGFATTPDTMLRAMGAKGRRWVEQHTAFEAFRTALQRLCAGAQA